MPRRKAAIKREVIPDPLYNSEQVSKFINVIMRAGKKSIAERIVYDALSMLVDRLKKEHKIDDEGGKSSKSSSSTGKPKSSSSSHKHDEVMGALKKSLDSVAPTVEVKSRRVGGATYQVPIEVPMDRGHALAMRWIVDAAKARNEKTMSLRLAAELHEAYLGRGAAVKTRDDVHRMAKANQAFAHYRW